jgi:hypothetical protein
MPDGFVKKPDSVLRCALRVFIVRKVRIITQDLRALNYGFFSLPLKHQSYELFNV